MPFLCTPIWVKGEKFAIPRPYAQAFSIGWWTHSVLSSGEFTVLQEVPFGGYRFYLRFNHWSYIWDSDTYTIRDMIADLYVTAPGDPTPISANTVQFDYRLDTVNNKFSVIIDNVPADGHYTRQLYPPAPPGYWLPPRGG